MFRRFLCVTVFMLTSSLPASAMSASVRWCSGSPEFKISDAPKGASRLNLQMTDLDVPSFNHGGGIVPFAPLIKCGALASATSYVGPSPPSGFHTYRWKIEALDEGGKVLASVTVDKRFPER